MIVVDTHVVSEVLRSRVEAPVVTWLDQQPIDECYLTSITGAALW